MIETNAASAASSIHEAPISLPPAQRRALVAAFSLLACLPLNAHPLLAAPLQAPVSTELAAPALHSLISDVAANEVKAIQHPDSYLRYRMRSIDRKGDRLRDIVESKDGTVARLIQSDGKPLTSEEDQAERDRLSNMIESPAAFARHIHGDATGKNLAIDLIRLMPDAMIYTYVPGQPQIASGNIRRQLVLDYAPNPRWSPPGTTAEALTGLRGRMWIDPDTRELLRMEGFIFRGVNFGWGVLAHIYPGGKLSLDQTSVGRDRLIFTRFTEDVKVKALMVKTLNERATIEASGFQVLHSPMSYQDAIHLLLATPLPTR